MYRRTVISEYFGEANPNIEKQDMSCCDVCDEKPDYIDCQGQIAAILKTVQSTPNKGEKQVGKNQLIIYNIHF